MVLAGMVAFRAGKPISAQDLTALAREVSMLEGQVDAWLKEPLGVEKQRSPTYVEERLTDGELYYQLKDYVRASIIFTDIVENHPNHPGFSDALFLLADSLFRAGDYLGARSRFREVLAHSNDPRFRPFIQRSLGRLIEIAVRIRDFTGIEEVFQRLATLPPSEVEASTNYYRGKYLYSQAVPTEEVLKANPEARIDPVTLEQARQAFESVAPRTPFYPQALYFIGVIHTLREQYPQAIDAFARVLQTEATLPEHGEVAELAQLALGRLYYETDQLDRAIEAYTAIPRTSSRFDTALYELAWAHIRRGDSTRAERALEVLMIAFPDSKFIPEAKLLRGNLLLRIGRLGEAERVFSEMLGELEPVQRDLDAMVADHRENLPAFFRKLVHENIEVFDPNAFLPPSAQRWAKMEGELDRALGILEAVSQIGQMLSETNSLIERLRAVLDSPNKLAIFADLRRLAERSVQLHNRVARLQKRILDASGAGAQLAEIQERRRELERFLSDMPINDEELAAFEAESIGRIRKLEKELARLEVEVAGLDARVTALTRYLDSPRRTQKDPVGDEGLRREIEGHRAAIADYRQEINNLKVAVEAAHLQAGVGDHRYQEQARLREEYHRLVEQEKACLLYTS
ncbi:MAG: tetratricopeptide repeat protein, partial [Deltaproteobacteria bacterium]|nr:tetratricopeptide repeat protein [Deltaproteobacteria bacterium]